MKKLTAAFLFLWLPLLARADILLPGDNFFPGWKKANKRMVFIKADLFNYIDGGADVFLEFGFERLFVQRYSKGESGLALEAYQMESPEAALGIYLMKCSPEEPVAGLPARTSGEKYQYTILKGDCFIQINNSSGDESLLLVMTALGREILASLPEQRPEDFFSRLPAEHRLPGTERLIRGPAALQSYYTFGEGDILMLGGKIFGAAANYQTENGETFTRLLIFYSDENSARSAFKNLLAKRDPELKIIESREDGFTFSDNQNKFGAVEIKGGLMDIRFNLSSHPFAQRSKSIERRTSDED